MLTTPDVSIVVPVHNDEDFITTALKSCLGQTWENIEVICVDDASTDATPDVIARLQDFDPRIRLLRQDRNQSAFQARRIGIMAAKAPYVLFLDGDDELMPGAVRTTLELARAEGADVVGFGVQVTGPDGPTGGKFERTLQPSHQILKEGAILSQLFPVGKIAQGHIWKYLWDVELLRGAYAGLSHELELYRANDLPITFLALASARKYVSTPERMLQYNWRRGTSGQAVEDETTFKFYLAGLTSVDAIALSVETLIQNYPDERAEILRAAYESARLSIVGNLLRYWVEIDSFDLRESCLLILGGRVPRTDIIRAAATFFSEALPYLVQHREVFTEASSHPARNVLLTATDLASGGAQGVVISQAKHLVEAGYRVVIGVRSDPETVYDLPPGVDLVRIWGATQAERIERYLSVCREYGVDVAIDHWILYREDWPFVALAAATLGVRTIGWIHNFALRPLFDSNLRISFLTSYLPLLWKVVTLSDTDVAFWKLRGIDQAVYLPNPPSPLLLERAPRTTPRALTEGPIRLAWWGRLQQSTKRLRELIEVASILRSLSIDFRLTIIGPDSRDLSAEKLALLAEDRGVGDAVILPGPMHGDALLSALEDTDVFVYTSAIEGYPLTLVEAQSLGLPVAMYELPWLATVQNNPGILVASQHDANGLALQIAEISRDPGRYSKLSAASLDAARSVLDHDFTLLYSQLLSDSLPARYSPAPTTEHAGILLDRAVAFAEQQIRWSRRREQGQKSQLDGLTKKRAQLTDQIGGLTQGIGELHRNNENLARDKARLNVRFENLAARAQRQRARVVELTRWRNEGQARVKELEEQLFELQRRVVGGPNSGGDTEESSASDV